jgi:hypothetical protein
LALERFLWNDTGLLGFVVAAGWLTWLACGGLEAINFDADLAQARISSFYLRSAHVHGQIPLMVRATSDTGP